MKFLIWILFFLQINSSKNQIYNIRDKFIYSLDTKLFYLFQNAYKYKKYTKYIKNIAPFFFEINYDNKTILALKTNDVYIINLKIFNELFFFDLFYNITKIIQFKNYGYYQEEYSFIKENLSKVFNDINYFYELKIKNHMEKIDKYNKKIIKILENSENSELNFKGKKKQIKEENNILKFLENLKNEEYYYNLYQLPLKPINYNLIINFKSYKSLIYEWKYKKWQSKTLGFLDILSLNLNYKTTNNKSISMMNKKDWEFSIKLNFLKIFSWFSNNHIHNNKKIYYMKINQVYNHKNKLKYQAYKKFIKNYKQIYEYRIILMKITEKSIISLKEKYKNNIYNNRKFFEILKIMENLSINLIKFQQQCHTKQWKLALKNPLSSLINR